MEAVTMLWSLGAAVAITLAVLCGLMWLGERRALSHLMLCLLGVATAAAAYIELGMMRSTDPAAFGAWLRWYHLPIFVGLLAQVLFVHFYLGTSRTWLLWTVILGRATVLALNFLLHPNFNFVSIDSLRTISFLGDRVSVIGQATYRGTQWFAVASLVLLLAYIADTAIRHRRQGGVESRRKALATFLAVGLPVLGTVVYVQFLAFGVLRTPVSNITWFLGALLMMAYETGREFILNRRARLELAELRGQVFQAERVNLLGQLSSALAHELSQPLTAISANLSTVRRHLNREQPDVGEISVILDDIALDDGRAVEIIERMRLLLKQRTIALEPVNPEEVIRNAVSLVRAEASSKHVALRLDLQPGLPRVFGDRVHLSQVLLNLLMNGVHAVQARPADARLIVVAARAVETTGEIEIGVQDSGGGIPHAMIDRIFEPFFTTKPEGMGMGLALSRTIIEAHGGRLWVDHPGPQEGAIFRFTLKPA
ncbi:MAG TPA: ATP-binding protein [Dongiaceae bacterium]|nr:ATP-binding protein [Dongiaceae bacterium]